MTNPLEAAQAVHARDSAVPFMDYVEYHLRAGYVVSRPDVFWLAIPMTRAKLECGWNPYWPTQDEPDCWYVSLLAGDMRAAWQTEPFPLPFYAFHRETPYRKRLSIWPRERLRART